MTEILEFPTDFNPDIKPVEVKDPGNMIPPDKALMKAVEEHLKRVIIFGVDQNDQIYFSATENDPMHIFFDIETARDMMKEIIRGALSNQRKNNDS